MDLGRLEQIDNWTWRVKRIAGTTGADALLYGDRELMAAMQYRA